MQQLTTDHVDLLVAAAADYGCLTSQTAAAFTSSGAAIAAQPNLAGRLLLEHLPATAPGEYRFRPVDRVDPIQVVKACHSYQYLAGIAPAYAGSRADKIVRLVLRAATEHLPGYADSAWVWTRPQIRCGAPLGLATSGWRPTVAGIEWTEDIEEFTNRWSEASLAVITAAAAAEITDHRLPARPDVYLVVETADLAASWPDISAAGVELLVTLPEGTGWLEDRVAQATAADPRTPMETVRAGGPHHQANH